jgi:hypothetical protein
MGKSTGQWPCIGQWRGIIGGISHWRVDWNRSVPQLGESCLEMQIESRALGRASKRHAQVSPRHQGHFMVRMLAKSIFQMGCHRRSTLNFTRGICALIQGRRCPHTWLVSSLDESVRHLWRPADESEHGLRSNKDCSPAQEAQGMGSP